MKLTRKTLRQRFEELGFHLEDFDGDYDAMVHTVLSKLEATEMVCEDLKRRKRLAEKALEGSLE